MRFSDFIGLLTGDFDGVGVLAGDDFRDDATLMLCDLDFSGVGRGGLLAVGHGIAVGSSTAAGEFTGAGVGVAIDPLFGVGAPSGSNNRPRRCDTVAEAGAEERGHRLRSCRCAPRAHYTHDLVHHG